MLRVFTDAYPYWKQCRFFANWHLTGLTRRNLSRLTCFYGHWGAGFLELLPSDTACMTLLRDPVEQLISWFEYMRRTIHNFDSVYGPELRHWKPVLEGDLESALRSPFLLAYMSNMQTKFLGVRFDFSPWLGKGQDGIADLRSAYHRAFQTADLDLAYNRAEDLLERMQVVGISERLSETANLTCDFVGIPRPGRTPRENIGPTRSTVGNAYHQSRVSPVLLDRLEQITRYDRQLHRLATTLLEERLAKQTAEPRPPLGLPPLLNLTAMRFSKLIWHSSRRFVGHRIQDTAQQKLRRAAENPSGEID